MEEKRKGVGQILTVNDGIVRIKGLEKVLSNEMIKFKGGIYGLALNLEVHSVGALVFGSDRFVNAKDFVFCTGNVLSIPTGWSLLGRVINALGEVIDGKGKLNLEWFNSIEKKAPGIIERTRINQSLETGVKVIDSLVPIGKGQRELILGDRKTGKTSLGIDAIIHQITSFKFNLKEKRNTSLVLCIYVAIGQRQSAIARIADLLEKKGCMSHTTVVSASAASPMGMQYIAPYSGVTIAEQWMNQGFDTLVIYDDLSKHAAVYRQMSLLLGRPPGREAYPGDVFYLHSRLLERAAKLKDKGSLTALPIVETVEGDVSAYIPTNVISITDGQIYLDVSYFSKGIRPAINPGLSVSRVGSAAQNKVMKKIAGSLKLELAQFREVEEFTKFGSSVDEATRKLLSRGQRLVELLIQPVLKTMSIERQILSIFSGVNGYLDEIELIVINKFEARLHSLISKSKLFLEQQRELTQKFEKENINKMIRNFTQYFVNLNSMLSILSINEVTSFSFDRTLSINEVTSFSFDILWIYLLGGILITIVATVVWVKEEVRLRKELRKRKKRAAEANSAQSSTTASKLAVIGVIVAIFLKYAKKIKEKIKEIYKKW